MARILYFIILKKANYKVILIKSLNQLPQLFSLAKTHKENLKILIFSKNRDNKKHLINFIHL